MSDPNCERCFGTGWYWYRKDPDGGAPIGGSPMYVACRCAIQIVVDPNQMEIGA